MAEIIGRKTEQALLREIYRSDTAEFVAIYGRRRVGKTFLVKEFFKETFAFQHTGLSPFELKGKKLITEQLKNFSYSLSAYGDDIREAPADWMEAFHRLIRLIEKKSSGKRQVVFIDELPWLDTPGSGFITAFEHFWNGWGAGRDNLMLIVCGSATSWMNDKLINHTGGLYGRLTHEIHLSPFTLAESERYYAKKGVVMDRYDLLQSYMVFGGIPYYMNGFRRGNSLAQNIDTLLFARDARFGDEFERLFASLFTHAEDYIRVVRFLSSSSEGFTRNEISKAALKSGGTLTKILKSLIESEFISVFKKYKGRAKDVRYKVTDPFCLFYLHFLDAGRPSDEHFWQNHQLSPSVNAWRGYAFENVCFHHLPEIKQALGIADVHTEASSWRFQGDADREGAQIDMLIDRDDRVINLCEIKFTKDEFTVTKEYDRKLRNRLQTFIDVAKPRSALHHTLITTYGLHFNEYAGEFQRVVTMEDLVR